MVPEKIVRHRGFGITALICNDFMEDCYTGEIRALLEDEDWASCEKRVPVCSGVVHSFGETELGLSTICAADLRCCLSTVAQRVGI